MKDKWRGGQETCLYKHHCQSSNQTPTHDTRQDPPEGGAAIGDDTIQSPCKTLCSLSDVIYSFFPYSTNQCKQLVRNFIWKFRPCLLHRWSPVCPSCTCSTAERKTLCLLLSSKRHNGFHPSSLQTDPFYLPVAVQLLSLAKAERDRQSYFTHPFVVPLTPSTTAEAQAATLDYKVNYLRLIPFQERSICKHPNEERPTTALHSLYIKLPAQWWPGS